MHERRSFHTFILIRPDKSEYTISKGETTLYGGIGYFVTPVINNCSNNLPDYAYGRISVQLYVRP